MYTLLWRTYNTAVMRSHKVPFLGILVYNVPTCTNQLQTTVIYVDVQFSSLYAYITALPVTGMLYVTC